MTTSTTRALALTGRCACCGEPTGSLFAMGHDARFRSRLATVLATDPAGWAASIEWHAADPLPVPVTVTVALEAIAELIGRDWTEKVERQASRLARSPVSGTRPSLHVAAPTSSAPARETSPTAFEARDFARERVDALLDRLDGRPLTGQWGWFRPPNAKRGVRHPARVQATHRDAGDSRIDLFCPGAFRAGTSDGVVTTGVDPADWLHDESARSA